MVGDHLNQCFQELWGQAIQHQNAYQTNLYNFYLCGKDEIIFKLRHFFFWMSCQGYLIISKIFWNIFARKSWFQGTSRESEKQECWKLTFLDNHWHSAKLTDIYWYLLTCEWILGFKEWNNIWNLNSYLSQKEQKKSYKNSSISSSIFTGKKNVFSIRTRFHEISRKNSRNLTKSSLKFVKIVVQVDRHA